MCKLHWKRPGPAPLIGGGNDSGSSLALYSTGLLLHDGKVIGVAPVPAPAVVECSLESAVAETAQVNPL